MLYKHGRKLVGDRTAKTRLSEMRVTETQFADDAEPPVMPSSLQQRDTRKWQMTLD